MNVISRADGSTIQIAFPGGSILSGGGGNDALIGSVGNDVFTGGLGIDQFIFQQQFIDPITGDLVGGYGGADVITDYQAIAGIGDEIKFRNVDNNIGFSIADDGQGNTLITVSDRANIDPTAGSSGNGNFAPSIIQTIVLNNVSALQLMSQGLLEVNGVDLNDTTQGVAKVFGTFDYVVGGLDSNFPLRSGGVAGNSIFTDFGFGQPGVAPENNLIAGDFVSPGEIGNLLAKIMQTVTDITIPGTNDPDIPADLRELLEAEKVIGQIPASLLPGNAFNFALDENGIVDLNRFTPAFAPATVNDDLIVGGPGNDFLIGGPGNDIIVGNQGTDIIWAGTGQDIIIGREGTDYIIFDSILEIRDRDDVQQDPISNARADARIGYIRYEEPYGTPLEDPFTTRTGPDILLVNSAAFNRGIDPITNPELAEQIGYLTPGTIISSDGTGTASTKNGQLVVGEGTVPVVNGAAEDDMQPTFYFSTGAARLFFDRDGSGTQFFDFWMSDLGTSGDPNDGFPPLTEVNGLPQNFNDIVNPPEILIYIY
ncbi:Hemolysin-type calcium-binding region [Thalassoporum mexicanum PCC 7367]|uniref:calcium-binding protein n=1 Tax=Thalassoporum mexicanum TaxID=3457544 RepID=UPI00029F8608|nr:hemolysin-type calcium-binding protein [Pseudanabaena sp. PCC 7367]AFY71679.1 Hemolysin-type calcium-binding region [Pseudanabaena sp. PCC 7367]